MLMIENRKKSAWRAFYRKRLRFMVLRRDSWTCQFCGRTVKDGAVITVDHIVPKSKGGDWCWANLTTACENCNTGKSDVLLTDLEAERFVCPASIIGPIKA